MKISHSFLAFSCAALLFTTQSYSLNSETDNMSHTSATENTQKTEKKPQVKQDKSDKISSKTTEGILLKLKWVKNASDAVIASNKLRQNAIKLGETFFADGGKSFRFDQDYYQEYAVEKVTDHEEINRYQSAELEELSSEIKILEEDLEVFLSSQSIQDSIDSFVKQNQEMIVQFKNMQNSAGPMLHSLAGMVLSDDGKNAHVLGDLHDYLVNTYKNFNSESEEVKKGIYAAMYIIASIFHNNDTKFAYLYDNELIIKHMGKYIAERYGDNPLLGFAIELAPFIDILNRQLGGVIDVASIRNFLTKYRWPIAVAITVGGVALFAYPSFLKARVKAAA